MHKLLTTLFAGALALSLGSAAFAADAVKPVEPTKTEAAVTAPDAKATQAKPVKKHTRKHAKKTAKVAAPAAAAALESK